MVAFNSIKNSNSLNIVFTFPKKDSLTSNTALNMISYLINHEEHDSLYQELKKLELILSMTSKVDASFKTIFYIFTISVSMTDKGLINYEQIIAYIFAYLDKIKESL